MNGRCAVTEDLNRLLAKEDAATRYNAAIEARAAELMKIGGEYHPWTIPNFQEAISEAKQPELMVAVVGAAAAILAGKLNNDHTNHFALVALRKVVEGYWYDLALYRAQRDIDSEL